MQDVELCRQRYSMAICRPIALRFTGEDSVSVLELAVREQDDILMLNTVDEKQYQLVPRTEISDKEQTVLKERESNYSVSPRG
jgi:hypothetical protein